MADKTEETGTSTKELVVVLERLQNVDKKVKESTRGKIFRPVPYWKWSGIRKKIEFNARRYRACYINPALTSWTCSDCKQPFPSELDFRFHNMTMHRNCARMMEEPNITMDYLFYLKRLGQYGRLHTEKYYYCHREDCRGGIDYWTQCALAVHLTECGKTNSSSGRRTKKYIFKKKVHTKINSALIKRVSPQKKVNQLVKNTSIKARNDEWDNPRQMPELSSNIQWKKMREKIVLDESVFVSNNPSSKNVRCHPLVNFNEPKSIKLGRGVELIEFPDTASNAQSNPCGQTPMQKQLISVKIPSFVGEKITAAVPGIVAILERSASYDSIIHCVVKMLVSEYHAKFKENSGDGETYTGESGESYIAYVPVSHRLSCESATSKSVRADAIIHEANKWPDKAENIRAEASKKADAAKRIARKLEKKGHTRKFVETRVALNAQSDEMKQKAKEILEKGELEAKSFIESAVAVRDKMMVQARDLREHAAWIHRENWKYTERNRRKELREGNEKGESNNILKARKRRDGELEPEQGSQLIGGKALVEGIQLQHGKEKKNDKEEWSWRDYSPQFDRKSVLLFPVYLNSHVFLLVLHVESKSGFCYDSLWDWISNKHREEMIKEMVLRLFSEHDVVFDYSLSEMSTSEKKRQRLVDETLGDPAYWNIIMETNCSQQHRGTNCCAIFVFHYIINILNNEPEKNMSALSRDDIIRYQNYIAARLVSTTDAGRQLLSSITEQCAGEQDEVE